ncbi:MAG: hypothetical protein ACREBU_02640 [Nitrososphaera sp.]
MLSAQILLAIIETRASQRQIEQAGRIVAPENAFYRAVPAVIADGRRGFAHAPSSRILSKRLGSEAITRSKMRIISSRVRLRLDAAASKWMAAAGGKSGIIPASAARKDRPNLRTCRWTLLGVVEMIESAAMRLAPRPRPRRNPRRAIRSLVHGVPLIAVRSGLAHPNPISEHSPGVPQHTIGLLKLQR